MLSIENISVFYGKIRALHDVSLHIDKGELVTLIGANGAGKSTLINTVSGLKSPGEGAVFFQGERIDGIYPEKIVKKGLIQVAEGRELFPALTVWENLTMGAYTLRDRKKVERNLARVFELFPILQERRQSLAQTLSGGEQQMLAIGRALMGDPSMVMLDEPSLGLAPLLVSRIFDVIRRLNHESRIPILLVEQNVFLSLKISLRGYVLERGRIVLEGKSEDLSKNSEVEKAYMGF